MNFKKDTEWQLAVRQRHPLLTRCGVYFYADDVLSHSLLQVAVVRPGFHHAQDNSCAFTCQFLKICHH